MGQGRSGDSCRAVHRQILDATGGSPQGQGQSVSFVRIRNSFCNCSSLSLKNCLPPSTKARRVISRERTSVRPNHLSDQKLRVAVGTAVACRPPHRPARAVFLHAVLTADTWRRSAGRGTDGGFGAGEATVQRNQSCASTSSGFSGYDVGGFVASVCSLHAESARD